MKRAASSKRPTALTGWGAYGPWRVGPWLSNSILGAAQGARNSGREQIRRSDRGGGRLSRRGAFEDAGDERSGVQPALPLQVLAISTDTAEGTGKAEAPHVLVHPVAGNG